MKANLRIKKAMRDNERDVLAHVRKYGRIALIGAMSISWHHAIDRLLASKRMRYSRKAGGYVAVKRRK